MNVEGSGAIEKISLPDNWVQGLYKNNRKNKIVSVQIADGITSIGNYVFSEWIFLKEVYIPESVVSFGISAFGVCLNLLKITIPQSVESMGICAFADCRNLCEISVADGNAVFTSINGVLFDRVRKKLKLLSYPAGKLVKRYVVPDGVTSIGPEAFGHCDNLIEVILPDSISYIGTMAFNNCRSLQQITFLGNAPRISEYAFRNVTATAYYPANDSSWTEEIRQGYCERIAPGETEQTCRAVGARAVFEKKIQEEDTWKIYKRAYKKYYARVMKGNMSREDFNAWVEHAAAERDFTIDWLAVAKSEEEKARFIEELREDLNRL